MRSLTIHDLDDTLYKKLKSEAQKSGLSLNKVMKKLLQRALGISRDRDAIQRNEFSEFLGVWSKKEMKDFNSKIADMETVDPRDWQ